MISPASLLRSRYSLWIAAVALSLICVLVYLPGLHGPFVFDDQVNILEQPGVRISSLSAEQIALAAKTRDGVSLQRAIPMVSFALNYYTSGFSPFAFKLTNLVIHLFNGIAIAFLTYLLLHLHQRGQKNPPFRDEGLRWISLAVAGLWLVHPLNLTTVLYVVQRMTGLASLFMFLGLIGYLVGRLRIINGRLSGYLWIAGSLLICTPLAVLSKENGILLPALIILVELTFLRFTAPADQIKSFRIFWLIVVLLPVIAGLGYGLWKANAWLALDVYAQRDFTLSERLMTEGRVIWFYLRLILLPDIRDMGLFHDDIPISREWLEPATTLPAALGIGALAIGGIFALRRWPMIGFVPLWFLLGHTMESTIIPLEIAHDHRNHLPMYGVLLGVVWHLCLPWKRISHRPQLRYAIVVVFFAILAVGTWARSTFWQDTWALATQDAINHPDSARAHTALAMALYKAKMNDNAHRHFERAASLRPQDTSTIIRLVHHLYLTTGKVPEHWLQELERRMMRYPSTVAALWVYEPLVRATRDDIKLQDRVIRLLENVVERPDLKFPTDWRSKIQYLIAIEAMERKNYPEALRRLDRARELHPANSQLLLGAEIYLQLKNPGKVREFTDSLMTTRDTLLPSHRARLDALRTAIDQHKTP